MSDNINPFEQAFADSASGLSDSSLGSADLSLGIDDSAVRRLRYLQVQESNDKLMLRIGIAGGGCSGYQYMFSLDSKSGVKDKVFERDGVLVVCDEISLQYLHGSVLEFVEELSGSAFVLRNPNAQSSCGCGVSFSV